ncbi:major facilitator superfamily domain-containing protein [Mycena sp. CBHHK59/15]|nr:major facilitator superfamily domain-containing protein [Mycena sp. CBHHK59/15]
MATPIDSECATDFNSKSFVVDAVHNAEPLARDTDSGPPASKSRAFWMSFVAIMVATFLGALDLTAVGTALPTIATALNDTKGDYVWVGSAYALSSTAFIPLSGSLADAFGRLVSLLLVRSTMLICITFFAIGSALAGASQNMKMMIAARGLRFFRIGGGGIINLSEILTADLVPLAERGIYQGMLGLIWAFASSIGPPIGGALSFRGNKSWRWLFYLNLPLTAIAFALVSVYLTVRQPEGSVRAKLKQVDWVGNAIGIVGAGLAIVGMTWGGIRYPWGSVQVLVPLLLGLALLVAFGIYEARVPSRPTIPLDVVGNRTSLSGQVLLAHRYLTKRVATYALTLPSVFFQACFGASPIRSAVDFLPGALITSPFAFVAGSLISVYKRYRVVNWIGWSVIIIGFGLLSTLREHSTVGQWVGYQLIVAMGTGMIFAAPTFPLLAPLPNTRAASALALFSFTRSFFQAWGITISSTILQNKLDKTLPPEFVARYPAGFEIAYAAIPAIRGLAEPLRSEVRAAFAESMAVIWQTMTGVAGLGLLVSFLMVEVQMDTTVDGSYALKEEKPGVKIAADVDAENAVGRSLPAIICTILDVVQMWSP